VGLEDIEETVTYIPRKDLKYKVNYIDIDTEEIIETKTVENQEYGKTIKTEEEIKEIENYVYKGVEKEEITIGEK